MAAKGFKIDKVTLIKDDLINLNEESLEVIDRVLRMDNRHFSQVGKALKLISRVVTVFLMMNASETGYPDQYGTRIKWYDLIAALNRMMPLETFYNHERDNRVQGSFTLKDYIIENFTSQMAYDALQAMKVDLE
mmetsp:Transcript_8640/g.13387  ORF Transcript_8640/g.13387 Transcript_8640/m.13387 type:complete len:134 (+) Transcript_8640:31-432(+)